MIITLMNKESIASIALPEKIRGQYWIYDNNGKSQRKLIGIEGINDEWILKSNKDVKVIDNSGNPIRNTVLSQLSIYNLAMKGQDNKPLIFTEPNTDDRQTFTKFLVDKDIDISIGRNEQNDIVFGNRFVSACHAKLSFYNGKWRIYDNNSTNGTFVNGVRVKNRDLNIGDMIYIMGFKIIVGSFFIALNNPDGTVSLHKNVLNPFINQVPKSEEDEDEYEAPAIDYFYRSPQQALRI